MLVGHALFAWSPCWRRWPSRAMVHREVATMVLQGVISMAQTVLCVQQICVRYESRAELGHVDVHVVDGGLATPSSWYEYGRCGIYAPARRHAGISSPAKPFGHSSSCIHVKLCDTTSCAAYHILLLHDKQQNTSPPVVASVARSEARTPP